MEEMTVKHYLYEGDNLDIMKKLMPIYKGAVDVMPIDPPYNTGIKYAGYDDEDFGGDWLDFMRSRLEAMHELLSNHGVAFIHIDENEFCALYGMCKDIFGSNNVMSMIWKKTNERFDKHRVEKPLEAGVRRIHEFVVVVFKDREHTRLNPISQPVWNGTCYVETSRPLETILDGMGTTSSAKDELVELLGDRTIFRTPKPVKLIKEFVRAAGNRNSVVMDIFAGSGTTGHAVMELNAEDGGKRQFILVTNNENDICKKVTLPRLKVVMDKIGVKDELEFIAQD